MRRVLVGVIASLIVLSVAWASEARADGKRPDSPANATAMGQSLYSQLTDHAVSFEFALEQNDHLELTGHSEGTTPSGAVAMAQSTAFGGGDLFCHLELGGDIEATLIVTGPTADLPQPCAVLGIAYEAAA